MTSSSRFGAISWLALAVVLVGAGLRWYGLDRWDMWTDEVQTLWTSAGGDFKEGPMYRTAPVNFALTGIAVRVFGANEIGLRVVPFLAGVAALPLFFAVFRSYVGRRAALFGMLVVALSMWHVFWSQTGRHFSLQFLLLLGLLWGFLDYWYSGRRKGLLAVVILGIAALFTHSSSGLYLLALVGFVSAAWVADLIRTDGHRSRRRQLEAAVALIVPLLVYLPVYVTVGSYLLANKEAWNPPWNIVGSLAFYVPPYLALVAAAGAFLLRRDKSDLWLLLACFVILPPVFVTIASSVTIASAAYCLGILIGVAALVGVAADRILVAGRMQGARIAAVAVVMAVFASQSYDLAHYFFFYNGLKPRWRDVTSFVGARRSAGDAFYAAEGDVARYYLGWDEASWLGQAPGEIGSDSGSSWYAVYLEPAPGGVDSWYARLSAATQVRLVAVFPLHYGAKDRSIAVFHDPRTISTTMAP